MIEVRGTRFANAVIDALPKKARRVYDAFEDDLAHRGCAALAYRLTGDAVEHICIRHLAGSLRVAVAFETPEIAYVLTVGVHDRADPTTDIYTQLYEAAGVKPPAQARRAKPPCCDEATSAPPVNPELASDLAAQLRQVGRVQRRRARAKARTGSK